MIERVKELLGVERWRYLNGIPNIEDNSYQVSSKGRVRRKSQKGWKYLQGTKDKTRVLVCLGRSTYNLGNLVLYGFGESDALRGKIMHLDGDPHNNTLKNVCLK